MSDYALYHGDDFVDLGTKQHLAERLNVKVRTIEFYNSRVYKTKRFKGNRFIVIKLED